MSSVTHHLQALRAELKAWEKSFSQANDGRKASREEIKADLYISLKYKEYSRLKAPQAPPSRGPLTAPGASPSKRCCSPEATPRKRLRRVRTFAEGAENTTPTKSEDGEAYATMKQTRSWVGPTPQKDGRMLGLFDALSPEHSTCAKSEADTVDRRIALAEVDVNTIFNAASTPSKVRSTPTKPMFDLSATPRKHSRTPQSESKRAWLDQFMTPSRRASTMAARTAASLTPSKEQLGSSTPSFLRRESHAPHILSAIAEGNEDDGEDDAAAVASPSAGPKKRKWMEAGLATRRPGFRPLGRSLSALIKDMRKAEDEEHDEEMDIMREMEGGGGSEHVREPEDVQVLDSQSIDAVLGPDRGVEEEDDTDDGKEQTAQPARRLWKKKGQKRQTRRVLLKPKSRLPGSDNIAVEAGDGVLKKPTDGASRHAGTPKDSGLVRGAETDEDGATLPGRERRQEDLGEEEEASEGEADDPATPSKKKRRVECSGGSSGTVAAVNGGESGGGGIVKKAARKVSALAHANFRKLKIRGKGGGSGQGKGRFGRRR